jgi:hypothetical protein
MSDDTEDNDNKEDMPNENEGNIFTWAEEHLEDEYWKNDPS